MRVAIFGAYKTGTTALFHLVRNALPRWTRTLFEELVYQPQPLDGFRGVLAKVIIDAEPVGVHASFLEFERKVGLVRDPRDWLVSGTLFMVQQVPALHADPGPYRGIIDLLRRKEADPRSLSLKAILEHLTEHHPEVTMDDLTEWMTDHFRVLVDFEEEAGLHFVLRYEDLVEGRVDRLAEYLGLPLAWPPAIPATHAHVPRTRSSGSWRNWFLDEDIEFFRPILEPYLLYHGYPPEWEPAAHPSIAPEHCTEYVARTVQMRRAGRVR